MKKLLLITGAMFLAVNIFAQTFHVTVSNGYGSGDYQVGDTVHIFTSHYGVNQLFDKWNGDVSLLASPDEWHTWFIMPNTNVNVSGSIKNITPVTLQFEQIMARDRLKPVYYYFPSGHKGFVYLLHGTGGKASYVAAEYEFQILIRDLINDNFGVIITEAEEATTGIDANGDGKLRWAIYPVDTINNVDYANIRIITDTFYTRGVTDRSKLRHSIGMSNGAFYSTALSGIYQFKAGVNYCGQSDAIITGATQTPLQFCMARNDQNDGVGQTGNADALTFSNALNARGICSNYLIKERSPIYPERFARRGDISTAQSLSIFNELLTKGYIDNKNYFIGYANSLTNAYSVNPTSFPIINSITASQRSFMLDQINLSVSDHQMYSDFNRATIRFLDSLCNTTANIDQLDLSKKSVHAYPNPFFDKIQMQNISGLENYQLSNSLGQIIWIGKNIEQQDFSYLKNGIYFLKVLTQTGQQSIKLSKQ